jgi:hypothetical protein
MPPSHKNGSAESEISQFKHLLLIYTDPLLVFEQVGTEM